MDPQTINALVGLAALGGVATGAISLAITLRTSRAGRGAAQASEQSLAATSGGVIQIGDVPRHPSQPQCSAVVAAPLQRIADLIEAGEKARQRDDERMSRLIQAGDERMTRSFERLGDVLRENAEAQRELAAQLRQGL